MIVVADPGHKDVQTTAEVRLEPHARRSLRTRSLDEHARTVDMLRAHPEWHDAIFLLAPTSSPASARKEPTRCCAWCNSAAERPGHPVEPGDLIVSSFRPRRAGQLGKYALGSLRRDVRVVIPAPSKSSTATVSMAAPATLNPLDVTELARRHCGARSGEARERRRDHGHAAGVHTPTTVIATGNNPRQTKGSDEVHARSAGGSAAAELDRRRGGGDGRRRLPRHRSARVHARRATSTGRRSLGRRQETLEAVA